MKASRHVYDNQLFLLQLSAECPYLHVIKALGCPYLHVIKALGCILTTARGALAVPVGGVAGRVSDDGQEQRGECCCAGRDGGRRSGRAPAAGAVLVHLPRRALRHSARQPLGRIMPWLGMRCQSNHYNLFLFNAYVRGIDSQTVCACAAYSFNKHLCQVLGHSARLSTSWYQGTKILGC